MSPEDPELNKEAELNKDAAAIAESKKMTEPQVPKTPAIATDERAAINQPRDHPRGQPVESEIAPSQSEPPQTDREATPKRESQSFMGTFEVVQDSFLRDKPQSDAAITILPPGTQVRVESRDGDYLRVRSLNDPELRGYVHREDAFFERIR